MSVILDNVCYKDKINNISYTFLDREINVITGGSGKSLLTYLMLGLVRLDRGSIKINNHKIDKNTKRLYNIRKDIGYVFQDARYEFFCKNCYLELEFSMKRYKIKDNINKKIKSIFKMIDLPYSYLSKSPFELSSGEQVKLAFGIALIHNPSILILDDITVNIDSKTKKMFLELIKRLRDKYNKTIIIISNDIDFILDVGDNIIVLDNGNIKCSIKKVDIVSNIDVIKNYIELPKIIEFIYLYNKCKNKRIDYTLDINLLLEDIINE